MNGTSGARLIFSSVCIELLLSQYRIGQFHTLGLPV